jgi:predicted nucleic acid-binding protein
VALVEASVRHGLEALVERLNLLDVVILPLPVAAAGPCLRAWREYLPRRRGATAPSRVPLPDFFIGAHAEALGATLATSDVDRYRTYFPQVKLLTPGPARARGRE